MTRRPIPRDAAEVLLHRASNATPGAACQRKTGRQIVIRKTTHIAIPRAPIIDFAAELTDERRGQALVVQVPSKGSVGGQAASSVQSGVRENVG
jgi:hypothetical protein